VTTFRDHARAGRARCLRRIGKGARLSTPSRTRWYIRSRAEFGGRPRACSSDARGVPARFERVPARSSGWPSCWS